MVAAATDTFAPSPHGEETAGQHPSLSVAAPAVVVVTHDINSAALSSHRIFALREGRAAFCGPPAELMNNSVLRDLYGKDFLFVDHPRTGGRMVVPEGIS